MVETERAQPTGAVLKEDEMKLEKNAGLIMGVSYIQCASRHPIDQVDRQTTAASFRSEVLSGYIYRIRIFTDTLFENPSGDLQPLIGATGSV